MKVGKDKSQSATATELRRDAEEQLHAQAADLNLPGVEETTQRLSHELDVHRSELEMQNEELQQARNELENALEIYSDLYDFAPVGLFTLDRNGTINAVNLSGVNLLGVERAKLLGRRFGLFVPDNARRSFADFIGKAFASQDKESCEAMLTTEGTSTLFVQIEALAGKSGQECRIAAIDITERKRAEEALAEKRQELEECNSSLEVRILQVVDELRQKDQMLVLQDRRAVMGEMINNIAHQWRQPLNTLGLLVQQVPIYFGSGEPKREFFKENTGKCMNLIQHMSRTVDDFRNFFKSDKEKITFGVNKAIGHTISLIEKGFKEQKISIAVQTEGDLMVDGYPNEYSQVLLNILMNARDALVGNDVDDARISIHSFAEGDTKVVTITDNAGGIGDEIIDKLFDPYFTTKGPDKGTGIGLFMSKTIIEKNMGGKLTVHNTGSGAEFRIEV